MTMKRNVILLLVVCMLFTNTTDIYATELPAQEELTTYNADVGEIEWDKIHGIDVISEIAGESEEITYQYDSEGNRVRKLAGSLEYLYSYFEGVLTEEQFGGHVVQYVSQNIYGDVIFTGCIIDGVLYEYERGENNYIVGLLNAAGECVLHYEYDENGALQKLVGIITTKVIGIQRNKDF